MENTVGCREELAIWRIERLLGKGATSLVYVARNAHGSLSALKVLRRELLTDSAAVLRFEREAEFAARVRHPSVVEVWGTTRTDACPAIMMELLEGGTLASKGPQRVADAVAITIAVLHALEACHRAGVVHRDVKPSNVFLTLDGGVKLLDFGVARAIGSRETSRHMAIGTPAYMSPEQARAAPVDARTDVFCAGMMLHALVLGRPPRDGDDTNILRAAAREGVPPLALAAPHLSRPLTSTIDRALSWAPEARWPTALAFAQALGAVELDRHASCAFYDEDPTLPGRPSALRALERRSTVPHRPKG